MLPSQRHLFDIPEDVAYLNCAYMSPLMRPVVEAGYAALAQKARPWELTADKFFTGAEEFRATTARLVDSAADCIAIVSSASYGIATAANNLPVTKGQAILVLDEQFPSNYYPWQRLAEERGADLKTVAWPEDGDWTSAVLQFVNGRGGGCGSASSSMDERRKTGPGPDRRSLPKGGTALVLDLTQSLGRFSFQCPRGAARFCDRGQLQVADGALHDGPYVCCAEMACWSAARRKLDSARQCARFCQSDSVHR